jgi:hypothetical protein
MRHQARPHCQTPARFFFFEKRSKKLFCSFWRALVNNRAPNEAKVFLLLFLQKKKILLTRSK